MVLEFLVFVYKNEIAGLSASSVVSDEMKVPRGKYD